MVVLRGSALLIDGSFQFPTGVGVSVELPAGVNFIRIEARRSNCSFSGTTASCHTQIFPGDSFAFELAIAVPAETPPGTTFLLPMNFAATPIGAPGTSTRVVTSLSTPPAPRSDLRVTHSGPATISPGARATWTTTITNDGPAAAPEVSMSARFNGPLTSVSASSVPSFFCGARTTTTGTHIVCDRGTIAAGTSVTFSFTGLASVAPAGTLVSTYASASSALIDPVPSNNSADANGVISAGADVRVTKTAPKRGTFEVVVTNDGPESATNVRLVDHLPWETTTFVSLTQLTGPTFNCITYSAGGEEREAQCSASSLEAGASAVFSVVVDIPPGSVLPIRNQAFVSASNDASPANNGATALMDPAQTIPTVSPSVLLLLAVALPAVAMLIMRRAL